MAFPEDVLTEDEHVVLHLHPHWKAMVRPVLVLALAVAAVVAGWILLPDGGAATTALYLLAGLAVLLVLWFGLWPFLVWRSTHYLFTNERVLLQQGVLSRDRRDIPLTRINDHAMSQRFVERLLGCGTLTIESAGERGQSVLADVPHVGKVQTKLYELVEAHHDRHSLGDGEMREILADMREGKPLRDPSV
ncbi:PH domain-containing protein [Micromonospora sp. KC207]|uniref:PH domain-containing protein n=1 Tax=Micromonospora carbonacea TaxID=47853 RepID=A0A7D5YAC9_9ACTN|nr:MULTISPECIES: PH domain-containing protein [unclassified Micromonospora]EEP73353.1 membrane-flanked domain-containing protein [Micromonospora sp. ATCC 39149]QLJ99360.1 PH domain-containing protein [Micromonospora carbonacea]TDC67329.1 PH domain-containing protein [Micromonospora sp. KC207]